MSIPGNIRPGVEFNRPLSSFFILLILAFLGANTLGQFLGLLFAFPFIEGNLISFSQNIMGNPNNKLPMYIMQGAASITGFILIPYFYVLRIQQKPITHFFAQHPDSNRLMLVTILLTIAFMFFNAFFIEWNSKMQFPEFLRGFEQFARRFEDSAQQITNFLTNFDSFGQFAIALFVIAVVPAVGEEFLFRGILQNMALSFTKNPHLAIWISAIFFSAFHLQFFGFVPRILLGALFGYLYFWSGSLRLAMLSHFINNGFTLTLVYLYNIDVTGFDIENTESVPFASVLIFTFITAMLLLLFRKISTATATNG